MSRKMHYGCQLVKRDFKHLKDHAAVIRSVTSFLCVSGLLFRTMTGPLREWCCCSVDIKNFNKIPHKVALIYHPSVHWLSLMKDVGMRRERKETAFIPFCCLVSEHRLQIQAVLKYLSLPEHKRVAEHYQCRGYWLYLCYVSLCFPAKPGSSIFFH